MDEKQEVTTINASKCRARFLVPLLIIVGACLLAASLFVLARIPQPAKVKFEQPPALKPINPVDQDASDIMRLALTSEKPQTTLSATSRLKYLAIPDLKEGMLALKTRGLLWDYIGVLPELHYLGYENAEEELNEYLASADLQTVVTALDALKRMPPMSCRDELLDCLKQPHSDMAYFGTRVLQAWGTSDDEINAILANIMTIAPMASSRIAAATTLYSLNVKKEQAWEELARLLENAEADLVPPILDFMKSSGDHRAPELIAAQLEKDRNRLVALAALTNLKWNGKLKVLEAWERKVTSREHYIILVSKEAMGIKTDFREIIAVAKSEKVGVADNEEGEQQAPGKPAKPPNETQIAVTLTEMISALKGWDSPKAIPYIEQIVEGAPRLVRMESTRALRKFENNRRAIDQAIRLLDGAKDARELRENAITLGYIDSGRSLARLHELMLKAEDEESKLTFAWAILNINRGNPASYKRR